MTFQELVLALERFWAKYGCVILQPYDLEVGAGTINPATFLRVLGPEPWNVAYVEPSRRPTDGRYGENPNRLQHYHQFQVILKPSPDNIQEIYLDSLESFGIDPLEHDIRFVEDDWESPTLGAWGLGWEVWLDGLEITQFTYFQQAGGFELKPISAEITYGIERIAMFLQGWTTSTTSSGTKRSPMATCTIEAKWSGRSTTSRRPMSLHLRLFDQYERESRALIEKGLVLPAYDYCLKCSHTFNILDARGAISVTERTDYIARVRDLARRVAEALSEAARGDGIPPAQEAAIGESQKKTDR